MTPPSAQTREHSMSNTPKTDTPRTEALLERHRREIAEQGETIGNRVLASDLPLRQVKEILGHARQLERELGEMQNLNAVNESGCNNALERLELSARVCAELTVTLSQAQAKIAELEKELSLVQLEIRSSDGDTSVLTKP